MHRLQLCLYAEILCKSTHHEAQPQPDQPLAHVVLQEVGVVPLYAVVQDGDHHVFAGVAPLPGCQDVHLRPAVTAFLAAVLQGGGKHSCKRAATPFQPTSASSQAGSLFNPPENTFTSHPLPYNS